MKLILFLPIYLIKRLKQLNIFIIASIEVFFGSFETGKNYLLSRFFWGRGNYYKNFLHAVVLMVTLGVFLFGIVNANSKSSTNIIALENPNQDILEPGHTIFGEKKLDPESGYIKVYTHTAKEGENLKTIAEDYNVPVSTIRWANIQLVGPFSKIVQPGWELKIPNFSGVLYKIKAGDTIQSIADKLKTDIFVISEINNIPPPEYKLPDVGQHIYIPDGVLTNWDEEVKIEEQHLAGAFEDPLSHKDCTGYYFYQKFHSYHNGIDLGLPWGCPIRAITAGRVIYAGWENISGYTVKIDHGGGLISYYYHGNGEIWVNVGDYIEQETDIMMMGNTGNSRGTHLHLTIKLNGKTINPEIYLPLKRRSYW